MFIVFSVSTPTNPTVPPPALLHSATLQVVENAPNHINKAEITEILWLVRNVSQSVSQEAWTAPIHIKKSFGEKKLSKK